MPKKRRSYEAGHKRKYLVVIDDTEECDRAVFWAAKRAGRTKSQIVMLRVIETAERSQQWLGVADIMKAWAVILVCGLLGGVVFSMIWMLVLRYFTGIMAWATIGIVNLMFILTTVMLAQKAGLVGDSAVGGGI